MNRCPGPGCTEHVASDTLACREHWFQVSRLIRRKVWRTWRMRLEIEGSALEIQDAIDRHEAAKKEAIATMRPLGSAR